MFFKRRRRTVPALAPETSNAAAAEAAFNALRRLDVNADAKAELVASGIAPTRISALYPDSEFAEITLSLSAKLPQLSPAALSNSVQRCIEVTDAVVAIMHGHLYRLGYEHLAQEDRPEEGARAALQVNFADHLAGHLAARGSDSPLLAAYQAANLANACWFAWQTATHRKALPTRLQARADELMLWVAFTFDIS